MTDAASLVGSILTTAGKVVSRVLDLYAKGEPEKASREAQRFVATTEKQLDADYDEAHDELAGRFKSGR